ncbi:hypothetical protein [Emergencia timonensis]|uniref:hypothetical protein n=1 Tax=Emergencia timonensis TaxID=1776384 RepID=UPI002494EF4D|nr:hypothetical protein [Emergencia timonensis]
MYNEIQKLKSMGFSKSRTAHKLQINFRTVSRYWDMPPADYAAAFKDRSRNMRNSSASRYEQDILFWLEQHPDLSGAQIYDWLYEKYQAPPQVAERTMRRYIAWLREQHTIPRKSAFRSYEAVQELPPAHPPHACREGEPGAHHQPGKTQRPACRKAPGKGTGKAGEPGGHG